MKVIMLKDLKKVAKKGQILDVKDGYGNNFLIKNGYAVLATQTGLNRLNVENKEAIKKEQDLIQSCEELKEKLNKLSLKFKVKTGDHDRVFGSISSKMIVDELKKQGYTIDKKSIKLDHQLSSLGFHDIEVELHKKVIAKIKLELIKER